MLGRGDRAFSYHLRTLPAMRNDDAELHCMEPYVYSQFITGKEHPYHFGRAHNSWLTGTASWSFVALSQYILGIRPSYDGLVIDPCLPSDFRSYSVRRIFRGRRFDIDVLNPHGVARGVRCLTVNGNAVQGNTVPLSDVRDNNHVVVIGRLLKYMQRPAEVAGNVKAPCRLQFLSRRYAISHPPVSRWDRRSGWH